MDNTVGVFEFEKALVVIDIAAMEVRPPARRFEVYGTQGSATITEPFEPATNIPPVPGCCGRGLCRR